MEGPTVPPFGQCLSLETTDFELDQRRYEKCCGPEWTCICFVLHALHRGRECKHSVLVWKCCSAAEHSRALEGPRQSVGIRIPNSRGHNRLILAFAKIASYFRTPMIAIDWEQRHCERRGGGGVASHLSPALGCGKASL